LVRPARRLFLQHSGKFELQPKNGWRRGFHRRVSIVRRLTDGLAKLCVEGERVGRVSETLLGAASLVLVPGQASARLRNQLLIALIATVILATIFFETPLARAQDFQIISVPAGQGDFIMNGLSADGSTIVGSAAQSFRWTAATGVVSLGSLAGYSSSSAFGVNSDGSVIVGTSENGGPAIAFRWTATTGMVGLGFLPGDDHSEARAVSADGSVVAGSSNNLSFNFQAYRWMATTGMVGLGFLPGSAQSVAFGISGDGSVVVGRSGNGGENIAFLWSAPTGMISLGSLPGSPYSEASGTNYDGSVVVGGTSTCSGFCPGQAFRWSASTGMVGLGYLPGQSGSTANAVNADGSVVVGASGSQAFRWTQSTGMQSIQGMLTADGVNLSGFSLQGAQGVSADGTIIAGNGSGTSGHVQPWLAVIPLNAFALLDLAGTDHSLSSLVWGGTVTNSGPSTATLTVGSDNTNTRFIGSIEEGTSTTALTKIGAGTLTLAGTSSYTGPTTVNGGILNVEGSIASSQVTVNAGTGLTGTGTVGDTMVARGGSLLPGNSTAGSSLGIAGNLAFQPGALYLVQVNPATASFATVTGAATLGGATVNAVFANGSYISKQYTILTAAAGVSGTFGALVNTNLPANFYTTLSYNANNAYFNLILNFAIHGGLNGNQQAVGNALTNFFNSNGSIPLIYGALSAAGLTQASGETATGAQQTTFDAMSQFMGVMTDPFLGRGNGINGSSSTYGYADETASAYAASRKPTDAIVMFTKGPPAPFEQRWSLWGAGFGGSQTTNGNAALGTNNTTSNIAGTAVGADYLFSPNTLLGFALAGGETNFSVAGGGSGRSDLFQAGAYLRHTNGPIYLSAALAYGWQDIATDRTVTVAGRDHLRAEFNANAYSGRLEGGYRFVAPVMGGIGITPYAAGQSTTFDLPSYAESVVSGTPNFALAYAAKSVTDARSELGLRADKSFAMTDGILTLRGRLAWAHDFDPDRSVAATFQTLPGASFVVNGAARVLDSALITASAEMKWLNGWSAAATFEGEFSQVTTSYAGKGVLRYAW
jgi:autotransporter-associated beta strand protein/probable HAF family extracellular repeat protein